MVQWLGLGAFTAVGLGSIPGQGAKIPKAAQRGQKKIPWSNRKLVMLGEVKEVCMVSVRKEGARRI